MAVAKSSRSIEPPHPYAVVSNIRQMRLFLILYIFYNGVFERCQYIRLYPQVGFQLVGNIFCSRKDTSPKPLTDSGISDGKKPFFHSLAAVVLSCSRVKGDPEGGGVMARSVQVRKSSRLIESHSTNHKYIPKRLLQAMWSPRPSYLRSSILPSS